jgi:hypothetical protein
MHNRQTGRIYYINHHGMKTTWDDPRPLPDGELLHATHAHTLVNDSFNARRAVPASAGAGGGGRSVSDWPLVCSFDPRRLADSAPRALFPRRRRWRRELRVGNVAGLAAAFVHNPRRRFF